MNEQYGLPLATLQKIRNTLEGFPEIEQAVLYGSRAKGNDRPGSDIDLALLGPLLDQRRLDKIADALDDLLLPQRIDLSIHHKITHPDLLAHIDRVGRLFYTRTPTPIAA